MDNSSRQTFTWTGHLSTFQEQDISLPALSQLVTAAGDTAIHTFSAKIISVNNSRDADSTNNIATSRFVSAPVWPSAFRVVMTTNSENVSGSTNVSENSWAIYNMNDGIVAKRTNATTRTAYTDTVKLRTGYYKLVVYDSSCDGLNWWFFPRLGITGGAFAVRKMGANTNIPIHGQYYTGSYNNDFGCGLTQYFYVLDTATLAINEITEENVSIEAYPNPAQNVVNVDFSGLQNVNGLIQIFDAMGRMVSETTCNTNHTQINVQSLVNGVYTIVFTNTDRGSGKLTARLLIAK
jgi:hypothetical protein